MARISGHGQIPTSPGFLIYLACLDLEDAVQASLGGYVLHWVYHHVSGLSWVAQAVLGRRHASSLRISPHWRGDAWESPVGPNTISMYQEVGTQLRGGSFLCTGISGLACVSSLSYPRGW